MGNRQSRDRRSPASSKSSEDYRCEKCRRYFPTLLRQVIHEAECEEPTTSTAASATSDSDEEAATSLGGLLLAMQLQQGSEQIQRLQRLQSLIESITEPGGASVETETDVPHLGLRVVRGPTWKWKDQDNGRGGIGTVVSLTDFAESKTVKVTWDSGHSNNYRAGAERSFDLLILDSATTGVTHPHVCCDGCHSTPTFADDDIIRGMRWKCLVCENLDLCTSCYMEDKHEVSHSFIRIDRNEADRVSLAPRSLSRQVQSKGMMMGATVVRGSDWKWDDQDGGEGKEGRIAEITGFNDKKTGDAVRVRWDVGTSNIYRRGHEGKLDLKSTTPANGWQYYVDHLPMLGDVKTADEEEQNSHSDFSVGDLVKISLPLDVLHEVAQASGSWDDAVTELFDKRGTVRRIAVNNDVIVEYNVEALGVDLNQKMWTFHPIVLEKVGNGGTSSFSSCTSSSISLIESELKERPTISDGETTVSDVPAHPKDMCRLCEEEKAIVIFRPCQHQLVCQGCSIRIKRCIGCQTIITEKTLPLAVECKKLKEQVEGLVEAQKCSICFDQMKSIAFSPCGHGSCVECSTKLSECHICRTEISGKLKIYL